MTANVDSLTTSAQKSELPPGVTAGQATRQIGMGRPPLEICDLPSPEAAFRFRRLGLQELMLFVLGPGLIGLAAAAGAGEWLSAPLIAGQFGLRGLGWVILVSALLQVFYNVELARFTLATGEPPVVAFGRVPPGAWLWTPLALLSLFLAFVLGEWVLTTGASLFALLAGRPPLPGEAAISRLLGVVLMLSTFLFALFGRRIERVLELSLGVFMVLILVSVPLIALVVVPLPYWWETISSLATFSPPPPGAGLGQLGALAGFTALASGLNFMFIGYYRDKGYGMGSRAGGLSGLFFGEKSSLPAAGKIFAENEQNSAHWRRWFRYLLVDQWGLFFTGSLVIMVVSCVLTGYLVQNAAEVPAPGGMLVFAADTLGAEFGPVLYGWALLIGFVFLYTTQVALIELLSRNLTDALYMNLRPVRRWCGEDARRLYYPAMVFVILLITAAIFLDPGDPLGLLGNLANFAAILFPLATLYLNAQLPRPARLGWWSTLVLLLNVLFFGFFFANFVAIQATGAPLVTF